MCLPNVSAFSGECQTEAEGRAQRLSAATPRCAALQIPMWRRAAAGGISDTLAVVRSNALLGGRGHA